VLKRIYGLKTDEVMGEWRKLHNVELRDVYSSPSMIRIIKSMKMWWVGYVARMGEKRILCTLLVGKPEGTGLLGRPRQVDSIKMDHVEIGWGALDCIGMAQHRENWKALVNVVMIVLVP
jgi:hypothetical protein